MPNICTREYVIFYTVLSNVQISKYLGSEIQPPLKQVTQNFNKHSYFRILKIKINTNTYFCCPTL